MMDKKTFRWKSWALFALSLTALGFMVAGAVLLRYQWSPNRLLIHGFCTALWLGVAGNALAAAASTRGR